MSVSATQPTSVQTTTSFDAEISALNSEIARIKTIIESAQEQYNIIDTRVKKLFIKENNYTKMFTDKAVEERDIQERIIEQSQKELKEAEAKLATLEKRVAVTACR